MKLLIMFLERTSHHNLRFQFLGIQVVAWKQSNSMRASLLWQGKRNKHPWYKLSEVLTTAVARLVLTV